MSDKSETLSHLKSALREKTETAPPTVREMDSTIRSGEVFPFDEAREELRKDKDS